MARKIFLFKLIDAMEELRLNEAKLNRLSRDVVLFITEVEAGYITSISLDGV